MNVNVSRVYFELPGETSHASFITDLNPKSAIQEEGDELKYTGIE